MKPKIIRPNTSAGKPANRVIERLRDKNNSRIEKGMKKSVKLIDAVISHPEELDGVKKVRTEVQATMAEYPLYR